MNPTAVKAKLIEVLQNIQAASGLDCPPIIGTTKPLEALPKFDSKIWPVAIGMLAANLGITIADDVNIFRIKKSNIALTIDESVKMIVELAAAQAAASGHAANAS